MSETKKDMCEEPPRKLDRWNVFLLAALVGLGGIQTYQGYVAIKQSEAALKQGEAVLKQGEAVLKQGEVAMRDRAEQLRPRLSLESSVNRLNRGAVSASVEVWQDPGRGRKEGSSKWPERIPKICGTE